MTRLMCIFYSSYEEEEYLEMVPDDECGSEKVASFTQYDYQQAGPSKRRKFEPSDSSDKGENDESFLFGAADNSKLVVKEKLCSFLDVDQRDNLPAQEKQKLGLNNNLGADASKSSLYVEYNLLLVFCLLIAFFLYILGLQLIRLKRHPSQFE